MKLKLLSWNIWGGTHFDEVAAFLRSADAGIIALQEVIDNEEGNSAEILAKELGYQCTHSIHMHLPRKFLPKHADQDGTVKFGTAILSKYPIVKGEAVDLSPEASRIATKANILIDGKIIHVVSLHLKHSHYQQPLAIQDIQVKNLLSMVSAENTIVMGDFNAVPESSVIQKMSESLTQTDTTNTPTWPLYVEGCSCADGSEPKYKIDYIFTTKDMQTISSETGSIKASDHAPISATVEI
jgi:endonuclease/exonuclease/phosphatase family metal-dependent hydrolase